MKILCWLQRSSHSTVTSVFTLTVLAVERYNAVAKPLQMLQLTRETVRYAIAATWAVSVGLNVPIFVHTGYKFKKAFCHQTYSKEGELTHIAFYVVFVFIIPFIVITFCYSKIVRTLYNISAVTPESNMPDKVKLRQKKTISENVADSYSCVCRVCFSSEYYSCSSLLSCCKPNCEGFGLLLLFLSFVINPFIYALHSSNYRSAFKTLLRCNHIDAMDQS